MCFLFSIIFDHQAFMAHIVWYSENMEEKTAQFYSETQTEQKYEFAADADISMMKFWACDVYQWDLYNSTSDTNIKSNATCNADWEMNNKLSSEDVRWRSFLRWGTVKVKLLKRSWWSDLRLKHDWWRIK